ncbi:MAG: HpcH/HpaI aldolase family protein [Bacillota bacterium]
MRVFDETLKPRLQNGETLFGQFVQIPSPALVEIAGYTGFDLVVIDNEHGPAGIETTEHLIRAARCGGVPAVVRLTELNEKEILRTLDAGAAGIMVPMVNTVEEAERAVRAAKYPPRGTRGAATSTRAGGYTVFGGLGHLQASDASTLVILQIESVEALQNLDAIARVAGVDALFIGPSDLSASMGYPTNPGHPAVQAAMIDAVNRIRAAGIQAGLMVSSVADYRVWQERGARLITMGGTNIITAAMQSLTRAIKEQQ